MSDHGTTLAKDSVMIADPVVDVQINSCLLREEEGKHLPDEESKEFDSLLQKYKSVFKPGGVAFPFIKHHINIGEYLLVSVLPYRISSAKKEILKKEIEDLFEKAS